MQKCGDIKLPTNRNFGFFFTIIFIMLGIYYLKESTLSRATFFMAIGAILLTITLLKEELLLPFNQLWARLGLLMGMIFSPVVLGILFFGLFTPLACCFRLFKRDELKLKLENSESYWRKREKNESLINNFENQF